MGTEEGHLLNLKWNASVLLTVQYLYNVKSPLKSVPKNLPNSFLEVVFMIHSLMRCKKYFWMIEVKLFLAPTYSQLFTIDYSWYNFFLRWKNFPSKCPFAT